MRDGWVVASSFPLNAKIREGWMGSEMVEDGGGRIGKVMRTKSMERLFFERTLQVD